MSYIGILEYVIGVIHDKDIWYYVGDKDANGKRLRTDERYSSFLVDAKRYTDEDVLRWELENLPKTLTYKISRNSALSEVPERVHGASGHLTR